MVGNTRYRGEGKGQHQTDRGTGPGCRRVWLVRKRQASLDPEKELDERNECDEEAKHSGIVVFELDIAVVVRHGADDGPKTEGEREAAYEPGWVEWVLWRHGDCGVWLVVVFDCCCRGLERGNQVQCETVYNEKRTNRNML